MNNIFYFAFVGIIVVVSLYIILKILIKKFNPEESKVKLYGILQGMSNREIISISCSIISYVFMIYLMASFIDLDIYIAIIVLFLTLVSGILIKNKKVIIDLVLSAISLVGIKVVYLIHDYIINEYMDMWMLLLLVFVMLFLFLYFFFFINIIVSIIATSIIIDNILYPHSLTVTSVNPAPVSSVFSVSFKVINLSKRMSCVFKYVIPEMQNIIINAKTIICFISVLFFNSWLSTPSK